MCLYHDGVDDGDIAYWQLVAIPRNVSPSSTPTRNTTAASVARAKHNNIILQQRPRGLGHIWAITIMNRTITITPTSVATILTTRTMANMIVATTHTIIATRITTTAASTQCVYCNNECDCYCITVYDSTTIIWTITPSTTTDTTHLWLFWQHSQFVTTTRTIFWVPLCLSKIYELLGRCFVKRLVRGGGNWFLKN